MITLNNCAHNSFSTLCTSMYLHRPYCTLHTVEECVFRHFQHRHHVYEASHEIGEHFPQRGDLSTNGYHPVCSLLSLSRPFEHLISKNVWLLFGTCTFIVEQMIYKAVIFRETNSSHQSFRFRTAGLRQLDRPSWFRLEFLQRHRLFVNPNILDMLHSKEIFRNSRYKIFPIEMAKNLVKIISRASKITCFVSMILEIYS